MGTEHTSLFFYSSSIRLSRGKVVNRIYELRSEIAVFLKEEGYKRSAEFCDKLFLMKVSYLADFFKKLNTPNLQLQRKNLNVFDLSEKVDSFCIKMHLWKNKLKENCFDMFPTLYRSIWDFPLEENHKV